MARRVVFTLLISLTLLSCAHRSPQVSGSGWRVNIPEEFRGDTALQTSWLYTEGVRLQAMDERIKGLEYFRAALELDSLHAPTHGKFAEFYLSQEDGVRALKHATIAYKQDTTNLHHANLYGYALMGNNRIDDAIGIYERLVAQEPKRVANHTLLAYLYARKGLPYKAISVLDSAEYKLGCIGEIVEPKRNLLIKTKLYDRAIGETLSDIANNPNRAENYTALGELYAATGRDSLAEVELRHALELNPQRLTSQLALANFYHQRKREADYLGVVRELFLGDALDVADKLSIYDTTVINDEAFYRRNFFTINTLASILRVKHPTNYEVLVRYGNHQIRAGEIDKARETFRSLAAEPTSPKSALLRLIGIDRYLGKRDSMMHYLDKAIERFPDDVDLLVTKAYELSQEEGGENRRQVESLFKLAIKKAPDANTKSDALTALGDLNEGRKAYGYYKEALRHNPNNARALNNWAYFLSVDGGSLSKALEMSTKACELEPSNATYLDTKAWVLHLLGRSGEAKRIMQQAISLDASGDSTLLLHYADILAAEGETFMAELYYKRALDAGEEPQLIEKRIEALKQNKKN